MQPAYIPKRQLPLTFEILVVPDIVVVESRLGTAPVKLLKPREPRALVVGFAFLIEHPRYLALDLDLFFEGQGALGAFILAEQVDSLAKAQPFAEKGVFQNQAVVRDMSWNLGKRTTESRPSRDPA